MTSPRLSVVTASFNHAPYLEERARSVLSQTLRAFEWIVVDDGSTDDSPERWDAIASADRRVRLVIRKDNRGMRETTNEALSLATGDYVHRAESDDSCDARLFERLVQRLDAEPDVAVAYCATRRIDGSGRSSGGLRQPVRPARVPGRLMLRRLAERNVVAGPSAVFRRRLLDDVGPFGVEPFSIACDWHFYLRVARADHDFAYDPRRWAFHRSHGANLSGIIGRELDVDLWWRESYLILRSVFGEGSGLAAEERALLRAGIRRISLDAARLAEEADRRGDPATARAIAERVEQEDPGATGSPVWRRTRGRLSPLARSGAEPSGDIGDDVSRPG